MIVIDHSPNFLADPFITNLVAGISHALNARNYGLLVQGAGQQTLERLSMLRSVVTDGICVLASGPLEERIEAIRTVAASGQPIVVFQEGIAVAESSDVCILRQDDEGAGRVVANHLFDHGASRLLFLNSDRVWAALTERIRGVRGAVSAAGGRASLDVLACIEEDFVETRRRVLDYVRHKGIPDAIIAGNDQMGIAAIKELQSIGLAVPRDVMVAGFNAFGFHRYSDPVLTTVRSAAYELGLRGADALMLRLETGSFRNLELVLPVELCVGGSTIKETDAT